MRLHLYGDGPRDEVTIPELLRNLLGFPVNCEFTQWMKLHVNGRGYGRKLAYAMIRAKKNRNIDGVVAVIDQDKDKNRNRWNAMKDKRESQRAGGNLVKTALGEAVPHGEAWLLDDDKAVRDGLGLSPSESIPKVGSGSQKPKQVLEALHKKSPRSEEGSLDVWADIAQRVTLGTCRSPVTTGFKAFAEEVEQQLAQEP